MKEEAWGIDATCALSLTNKAKPTAWNNNTTFLLFPFVPSLPLNVLMLFSNNYTMRCLLGTMHCQPIHKLQLHVTCDINCSPF